MQHGQVEAGAVPAHERRRQPLDAVEEPPHEFVLGRARVAQAPDLEAVARPHRDRDRDDALLLERQELGACLLALARLHHVADLLVGQAVQAVQAAAELDVRYGLDVEREDVLHEGHGEFSTRRISTATATTSPASSVSVTCPSPAPSRRGPRRPRSDQIDFGPAPRVRRDADVADPDAVRKAGAERLDDGFLGGEAHGQEAHGPLVAAKCGLLLGHQQATHEVLAVACVDRFDSCQLHDVGADAEDHSPGTQATLVGRPRRAWSMSSLHVAHGRREAVEHGACDDRVADVELDDLRRSPRPAARCGSAGRAPRAR